MNGKSFTSKSRLLITGSLLFLFLSHCGFSITSSKSGGRSFPMAGNFNDVWEATIDALEKEKIPLAVENKETGYIQTATFPLYKKEYKRWAKAPALSSSGFCALEIGIVEKDPNFTILGIKAYFKRKSRLSSRGFLRRRDKSRGVFEGLLAYRIHKKLVDTKYPKMKSIVSGCNLHYDDDILHYRIEEADPEGLAYEQGLRNGDILLRIDNEQVTPANLFDFFLEVNGEDKKKITVKRGKEEMDFLVSVFYLDPDGPHFGFQVKRDPETRKFKVVAVRDGSPARVAGLLPGDVLLTQNGFVLDSNLNYYRAILAQIPGEEQVFQIDRGGDRLEKRIIPEAIHANINGPD